MSNDEILDLWDEMASVRASSNAASVEALEKAADLVDAFCSVAKDVGKDVVAESVEAHRTFFVRSIAKRYQTLIDEGKI